MRLAILLAAGLTLFLTALPIFASTGTNYLPEAALVDQAGHPVSFAALKGKPLLIAFIHASCQGICEMLTEKMKGVAAQLDPGFSAKVTMVSVTTDPAEDNPVALTAYAKKQGTVGNGWLFLTGKHDEIAKVLNAYNVRQGDEETHVLQIYLIGADGQKLHEYDGMKVAAATVATDVRTADGHR